MLNQRDNFAFNPPSAVSSPPFSPRISIRLAVSSPAIVTSASLPSSAAVYANAGATEFNVSRVRSFAFRASHADTPAYELGARCDAEFALATEYRMRIPARARARESIIYYEYIIITRAARARGILLGITVTSELLFNGDNTIAIVRLYVSGNVRDARQNRNL